MESSTGKKHAGFGMTCAHDDEAPLDTPVTAQDILCAGAAPANNDSCERVIAKVRYWKTKSCEAESIRG